MRRDVQGGATAKSPPDAEYGRRARALPARQPAGELPAPSGSVREVRARPRGWLWYLVACLFAASLFFAIQPADSGVGLLLANVLYDGLGVASACAIVIGARRYRVAKPLAWYLIAGGL